MDDKLERMVKVVEGVGPMAIRSRLDGQPLSGWRGASDGTCATIADWLRACDVVEERRRGCLVYGQPKPVAWKPEPFIEVPPAPCAHANYYRNGEGPMVCYDCGAKTPVPPPAVPCRIGVLGSWECPCAECETFRVRHDGVGLVPSLEDRLRQVPAAPAEPILRQPAPRHPFITMPGPGGRGAWQP